MHSRAADAACRGAVRRLIDLLHLHPGAVDSRCLVRRLATGVIELLTDDAAREEQIRVGAEWAWRYDWSRVAEISDSAAPLPAGPISRPNVNYSDHSSHMDYLWMHSSTNLQGYATTEKFAACLFYNPVDADLKPQLGSFRSALVLNNPSPTATVTGQITLRAEVPNPDGMLLPGQFVRVRLSQAELPAGILLPQQAVTRSGKADTVMVVGADNHATPRVVKLGPAQGSNWVVLDGLKAGEQVMVDGFQKLQMLPPGTPVKPVPWQAPGTPAPAAATASAPTSAEAPAAPASAASKP